MNRHSHRLYQSEGKLGPHSFYKKYFRTQLMQFNYYLIR